MGETQELVVREEGEAGPLTITLAANGILIWIEPGVPMASLVFLSPWGVKTSVPCPVQDPRGLVVDGLNRLWCLGAKGGLLVDLGTLIAEGGLNPRRFMRGFPVHQGIDGPPVDGVAADPKGGVWAYAGDQIFHFECSASEGTREVTQRSTRLGLKGPLRGVGTFKDAYTFTQPEADLIRSLTPAATGPLKTRAVPKGGRPRAVVKTRNGWIYATCPGTGEVVSFDPAQEEMMNIVSIGTPGPTLEPFDITQGSDDNIWITSRRDRMVLRLKPDGQATGFPLGAGMVPLDFIGSFNGSLLFTMEGNRSIGSVRCLPPPPPSEGWAHVIPFQRRPVKLRPVPERKVGPREEGKTEADPWAPTLGPPAEAKVSSGSESKEEKKVAPLPVRPPKPAAPRASFAQRLENAGYRLLPRDLRHILRHHGHGVHRLRPARTLSEFTAEFSDRAGLERILAVGLEDNEPDRIRSTTTANTLLICSREGVGRSRYGDGWAVADRFVVVIRPRTWDGQRWVREIDTVFPVLDSW